MKLIEKNSWVSDNGLWKVFYRVLEQDGIIVSEIRVRKSAGHNIWRDVRKKDIPKYGAKTFRSNRKNQLYQND